MRPADIMRCDAEGDSWNQWRAQYRIDMHAILLGQAVSYLRGGDLDKAGECVIDSYSLYARHGYCDDVTDSLARELRLSLDSLIVAERERRIRARSVTARIDRRLVTAT